VLDDFSSGHRMHVPAEAKLIDGSVVLDDDLERCFALKPDYVVHLATLFANQNSVDHPEKDLEVNGLGTFKVLECSRRRGVRKVVYTSSSCVYGNSALMHEEDVEFAVDTPYAITKRLGEQYCIFFATFHKLNVVSVRVFNTYGPGEYPGPYRNVIPNFFKIAMTGEPLPITGTGEETRDFTFVTDTAKGIMSALTCETEPGDVFNLGSGQETRIIDLAKKINRLTGNSAGTTPQPRRSWDKVLRRCASVEKAKRILDYQPIVSLDDGLAATYEWLKSVEI